MANRPGNRQSTKPVTRKGASISKATKRGANKAVKASKSRQNRSGRNR